eukprot:maker-scaffold_2-snap-gene-12.5-mRNA-1 protein AED:0.23 eAED:0.26 QI:0/0/0/0.5/1/1/2/0/425
MKLLNKNISQKDGSGDIRVIPQDVEELWQCYNLVQAHDVFIVSTKRKIISEKGNSSQAKKMFVKLRLRVISTDFDPKTGEIRVSGRNEQENKFVKLGAHHTATITKNQVFNLYKDVWDLVTLKSLDALTNPVSQAKLAAVVMQEGLSNVLLLTSSLTLQRARVEKTLPKKKAHFSKQKHSNSLQKFYISTLMALINNVDLTTLNCLIIASPGFVKDDFFKFIREESFNLISPQLLKVSDDIDAAKNFEILVKSSQKSENTGLNVLLVASSSGYKHSLDEILKDEKVLNQVKDISAVKEIKIMQTFLKYLNLDNNKAIYSLKYVQFAHSWQAVEKLLIAENLFKSESLQERKFYVKFVEECEQSGAEIVVFSGMHGSGEQLLRLGGIAALLRYPIENIEDLVEQQEREKGLEPTKNNSLILPISDF